MSADPLLPNWHGQDLYDQLKHIRNALPDLEAILRDAPTRKPPDIVTPLAQAHAVLATQNRPRHAARVPPGESGRDCKRKKQPQPKQLNLF